MDLQDLELWKACSTDATLDKLTIKEFNLLVRKVRDFVVQHAAEQVAIEHRLHTEGTAGLCLEGEKVVLEGSQRSPVE